jgi:hypothetical protein
MDQTELMGKALTGYHKSDSFIATRKMMGGRPVFHLDMSIAQLTTGVDAPPINTQQEDNRIVKLSRGQAFADYLNTNKEWASPSLLLWCPIGIFQDLLDDGIGYRIVFFKLRRKLGATSTDDFGNLFGIEFGFLHGF